MKPAAAQGPGLLRFVDAQAPVYATVLDELRAGRKASHWMWFVFPQLKGLGHSATAMFYGLDGPAEAAAYWKHALLGARLLQCTELVLATRVKTAHDIFGSPDDLKLRSCMTLFDAVAPEQPAFRAVLARFFADRPDPATLALLR